MISVAIHHTCASSWKLFRGVKARGLPVEFVPASFPHLRRMAVGIPAVFINGELVLYDPVTVEDLEALVSGSARQELAPDRAVENFITGVVYNQAFLALSVLHGSFRPLLADREVVEVLTRARFHGDLKAAEAARAKIEREDRELFAENRELMLKSLAYGLTRELYWLGLKPSSLSAEHVSMWLLAKATVGRIGLQYPRPHVDRATADAVAAILKERGEHYMAKIAEEQAAISADAEFLSLFAER
ncbi:MAG: thioredoxin [Thermoproteus sp.]